MACAGSISNSKFLAWIWSGNVFASASMFRSLRHDSSHQRNITEGDLSLISFADVRLRERASNIVCPLPPHNALQYRMISALSPIVIAYVINMVRWQIQKQERKNDAISIVTKPYLSWSKWCCCPEISGCRSLECSKTLETQLNIWLITYPCAKPLIWSIGCTRGTIMIALCVVTGGGRHYMVCKPPRGLHDQLASDGARILQECCNSQRWVSMPDLFEIKQRDHKSVTDFIVRWRRHTFGCPQKSTQQ